MPKSLCLLTLCLITTLVSAEPRQTPVAAASAIPAKLDIVRRSAGTYYLPARIVGIGQVDLLVDTGSSHMVISRALLEQIRATQPTAYAYTVRGTMADGSRSEVAVHRIGSIQLGPACWVHDVEAAVMEHNVRPILGMNVLSKVAPFTLSMEPAALTIHRCSAVEQPGQVALTKG